MTAPIDKLLPLLRGVRPTSPGRWTATCPTRNEKSPSLAIRERDDGALLLHDFGGATVGEIVASVGLELSDLFPERAHEPGGGRPRERRPFTAQDLIGLAAFEAGMVVVITADILNGRDDVDRQRLIESARRLADMWEVASERR